MRTVYQQIITNLSAITLKRFKHIILVLIFVLIAFSVVKIATGGAMKGLSFSFDYRFMLFVLAGFMAQLIDGALGMAYGVSCSSMLIAFNVPPVISSASVHISEVFTSGVSGLSHIRFKNVHRQLLIRLIIPGILGSAAGAFLLSKFFTGNWIKPLISAYLMVLGLLILRKVFMKLPSRQENVRHIRKLALLGGFLDAIGGGGWGPIVVTNLIHQGGNPRRTIGTANTAEFFIAFVSSSVFIAMISIGNWQPVIGILLGGVMAAPLAAFMVRIIKPRLMMIIVGSLITLLSLYNIFHSLPALKAYTLALF